MFRLYYTKDYLQYFRQHVGACGIHVVSPYPGRLEIDVFVPWWHYFKLWLNEVDAVEDLDHEKTAGLEVVCKFQLVARIWKWKGIVK